MLARVLRDTLGPHHARIFDAQIRHPGNPARQPHCLPAAEPGSTPVILGGQWAWVSLVSLSTKTAGSSHVIAAKLERIPTSRSAYRQHPTAQRAADNVALSFIRRRHQAGRLMGEHTLGTLGCAGVVKYVRFEQIDTPRCDPALPGCWLLAAHPDAPGLDFEESRRRRVSTSAGEPSSLLEAGTPCRDTGDRLDARTRCDSRLPANFHTALPKGYGEKLHDAGRLSTARAPTRQTDPEQSTRGVQARAGRSGAAHFPMTRPRRTACVVTGFNKRRLVFRVGAAAAFASSWHLRAERPGVSIQGRDATEKALATQRGTSIRNWSCSSRPRQGRRYGRNSAFRQRSINPDRAQSRQCRTISSSRAVRTGLCGLIFTSGRSSPQRAVALRLAAAAKREIGLLRPDPRPNF
jgi:hypothetical protein